MRKIPIAPLAAFALGGTLAVTSSAMAEQQTYQLADFASVSAVGPHRVLVEVGPAGSVRAEGPQESLDEMTVKVEDGELKIVPKREHWDHNEWNRWQELNPATYYVTLPRLEAAAIVGSGEMTIDRIDGPRFSGTIAGSARLAIAQIAVEDGRFSVAGSGDLVAGGSVRNGQFSVAGSGRIKGRDLTSQTASVSIAGSGDIDLTVKNTAHVSTVGSGDVAIAGGALCTVSSFGSGKARCNGVVVEDDHAGRWGMWGAPSAPPAPPAPEWSWSPWRGGSGRGERDRGDDD